MSLTYAYAGSTEVSKEILERAAIDPALVISFTDSYRERISGFTTYEDHANWEQVESINSEEAKTLLRQHGIDVLLVMAWQELLDPEVLEIPDQGCVGRHLSLLPKRRGRAPVAWALIHGLAETGVSLFWLDEGVDTGDLIDQRTVSIDPEDEAHDLHRKLTDVTVELLEELVPMFEAGEFPRQPQDDSRSTYTHPRRPDMGLIDWSNAATRLHDFIRGQTHPYPGAFTYHEMDRIRVWHASVDHPTARGGQPGRVLTELDPDTFLVQTGEGTLRIETENEDGNHPVERGDVLGCLPGSK